MGVPEGGVPQGFAPRPPMQAPPANIGPVTIPQHNPGNFLQATSKLGAALKMIEEAIPAIPLGTPLHTSVLKIATDLGKSLGEHHENVASERQTLVQALRGLGNQSQMAALSRLGPQPQTPATPAPTPAPAMAA